MSYPNIIEGFEDLRCFQHEHERIEAEYFRFSKNLEFHQRLLCGKCLSQAKGPEKTMSILQIQCIVEEQCCQTQEILQERYKGAMRDFEELLEKIESLMTGFCQLREKIKEARILDQAIFKKAVIIPILQILMTRYDHQNTQSFTSSIQQILNEKCIQQFHMKNKDFQIKINKISQQQKLLLQIQKIQELLNRYENDLNNQIKSIVIENENQNELQAFGSPFLFNKDQFQPDQSNNPIKIYQVEKKVQQKELCKTIAFNYNATIMATSCQNLVKLWAFEQGNVMDNYETFQEHSDTVICIVFSRKQNIMVSSGNDHKIILRNVQQNIKGPFINKLDNLNSFCLLFNSEETQLTAGCSNGQIIIFEIDTMQIKLVESIRYSAHTDCIYSIAYNKKNTVMASCSKDKQIIIWQNHGNLLMPRKRVIEKPVDDIGYLVQFVDNQTLAWMQFSNGTIYLFSIQNGKISQKKTQLIIKSYNSLCAFPQISLSEGRFLISIIGGQVHFLKLNQDGSLLSQNQLVCQTPNLYGGYSEYGNFFVYWDEKTKYFSSYKINQR